MCAHTSLFVPEGQGFSVGWKQSMQRPYRHNIHI